jgi:hypothetical protein
MYFGIRVSGVAARGNHRPNFDRTNRNLERTHPGFKFNEMRM